MSVAAAGLAESVRSAAITLSGEPADFDPILELVGNARFVLIGEASHGTHEFYRIRGEITKRLIREMNFNAVAVEADWPDSYRVNRFVRGVTDDADAAEALGGFTRFPQWMWRNADVLDFVGWLRSHNDSLGDARRRVGFYGLDLYSMHASMEAVLAYLRIVDPDAARRAMYRFSCFDQFGEDPQAYGYAASYGYSDSCEKEVVDQLVDLRLSAAEYARRNGRILPDALFYAEQNAVLVRNAERYYRSMFGNRLSSWNLRDQHMAEMLEGLVAFLDRELSAPSKVVIWAHNSHLGDARATQMGEEGELNLGQLVREKWGDQAVLIGFSTYAGTVTAASNWDAPAERKKVRSALHDSYEALFHEAGQQGNLLLDLTRNDEAVRKLRSPRLQRAIGVIYRPESERISHYFRARLPMQFNVMLHYDVTRAVEPLERTGAWDAGELPETFPSAL